MAVRKMTISLSTSIDNIPIEVVGIQQIPNSVAYYDLGQTVLFVNIIDTYSVTTNAPVELEYGNQDLSTVALLNYKNWTSSSGNLIVEESEGWAPIKAAEASAESLACSIYKQEITFNELGEEIPLTIYSPVQTRATRFHIRDYNISNNRLYRYIVYPASADKPLMSVSDIGYAKWQNWSITELHPVEGNSKQFTVTADDVWLFSGNIEPAAQTQNIVMNEQQTLGIFPRYSQGRQNYISSSITCLLGEMLPANYVKKKMSHNIKSEKTGLGEVIFTWEDVNIGNYQEKLSKQITSNEKVDMLLAWRRIVHSGNPKLLKDRKGQSFLVAITENSNTTNEMVGKLPETISFSWSQIGSLENIEIIDTSLRGAINE